MNKLLYMTVATIFLCGFIYGQQTRSLADLARESKVTPTPANPCPPSAGKPSRPAPAVADLTDEPDACTYMNGVIKLFAEGKFSELEHIAAVARSSKARFAGGGWKLRTFYLGVGSIPYYNASQADWDSHFASLKDWLARQPASVTPYVALASFYLSDGWKARGNYTADTVTEDGWRVFDERVQQARAILNQAQGLKTKCPEWYHVMMTVAVAQGWDPREEKALFDEAIAFEPEYYYFYQRVAWYFMPKWHGNPGDFANFTQTMANRVGGKDGDIVYWQIAAGILSGCGNCTDGMDLSWIRIRRGYRALVEKYGEALVRQNEMCYMAVKFGDPLLAQELFARIGENWTGAWRERKYFDNGRNWAVAHAAQLEPIKDVYHQVAANLETPEGEAYAGLVAREFVAAFALSVRQCAVLEPPQTGHVDIALKMGQSGAIEQVIVYPETAIGDCLRPKVQKAAFSSPPKPEYWVSFPVPSM